MPATATKEQSVTEPVIEESEPLTAEQAFVPPRIKVGENVLWFENANRRNPQAAVVVEAEGRAIAVLKCGLNTAPTPRDSVYHLDDPILLRGGDRLKAGAWDYTDSMKRLIVLEKLMEGLK